MRKSLDDEQVTELLQISQSSLRRYASGRRETPREIAVRLRMLRRIVVALDGSYNNDGIRRWFERPRAQLDGRSPAEILIGAASDGDLEFAKVAGLAQGLEGPSVAA